MSRILIVEDEQHLAEGLKFNLEADGHEVKLADTGEAGLALFEQGAEFDVLILDVMLPGKNGFTVMRELRDAKRFVPTLILTARGHADDVLKGFEAGADDYLTKPFELAILLARVRSLLRRREWLQPQAEEPKGQFQFDGKTVNFDKLELHVRDQVVRLTLMEANLLKYLIKHEGKPVTRAAMLDEVWGVHEDTDTRPIDNFIVRLRRHIEEDPTHPRHLLTQRGVGYRFVAQP